MQSVDRSLQIHQWVVHPGAGSRAQSWAACALFSPLSCLLHGQPPSYTALQALRHFHHHSEIRRMKDAVATWSIILWCPNVETPTEKLEIDGKLKCLLQRHTQQEADSVYPRNSCQELSRRNINESRSQLNLPLTGTLALSSSYILILHMRSWRSWAVK